MKQILVNTYFIGQKEYLLATRRRGTGGGTFGQIAGSKLSQLSFATTTVIVKLNLKLLCMKLRINENYFYWLPFYLGAEREATNRHLTIAYSLSNPTIFALTVDTSIHQLSLNWQIRT